MKRWEEERVCLGRRGYRNDAPAFALCFFALLFRSTPLFLRHLSHLLLVFFSDGVCMLFTLKEKGKREKRRQCGWLWFF